MNDSDSVKNYLLPILSAAVILFCIVALLGRIQLSTELERDVLEHTLIDYVDENTYCEMTMVKAEQWPAWTKEYDCYDGDMVLYFDESHPGRIGIFADVIYYEKRHELRTWFSGRLLERNSEYYYKPAGELYLDEVYEMGKLPEISFEELVQEAFVQ